MFMKNFLPQNFRKMLFLKFYQKKFFQTKKIVSLQSEKKEVKRKDMYLTAEKKSEFFSAYGKNAQDTGSAEGQIALFTFRIKHLTEHMKQNKKDVATMRSLVRLVGKRRRLLDYLKNKDIERYRTIIKELGIRK